jgi:hypothetical protein
LTIASTIELAVGAMFIVAGVWRYRRRGKEDGRYGSQSAVLLLVVGALALIHGSGLLEYRETWI